MNRNILFRIILFVFIGAGCSPLFQKATPPGAKLPEAVSPASTTADSNEVDLTPEKSGSSTWVINSSYESSLSVLPEELNEESEPAPTNNVNDSTQTDIEAFIEEQLCIIENLYGSGTVLARERKWTEAQAHLEEALDKIVELDLDQEATPELHQRANLLLKKIGSELKVVLIAQGQLGEETSIASFLDRFQSIENFKALREQAHLQPLSKPEAAIGFDIPIVWNSRVEDAMTYFQTVAKEPFTRYLERCGKYIELMRSIFKEKMLPLDLAYLPLIESGYNPHAVSYARAVGPWQFIASTGRLYGLKTTWEIDQRRDFVKSTYAAAEYLKFLYERYQDWYLALAAYNGGPGRIDRTINRQGTDNFWEMNLRKQTEDYVPLYIAATIIAKEPQKYGFTVYPEEPLQFDLVDINRPIELKAVAKALAVEPPLVYELNPELLRGVTPSNVSRYQLRIPAGTLPLFLAQYSSMPTVKKIKYLAHRVRRGESLNSIATRYGVSVATLISVNHLGKGNRLRIGKKILIPVATAEKTYATRLTKSKKLRSDTHIVQRGETLAEIASRYDVSVARLAQANNIPNPHQIRAGLQLSIPARNNPPEKIGKQVVWYIVKSGDTLWDIAKAFETSMEQILSWNPFLNPSRIQAGTRIKILK